MTHIYCSPFGTIQIKDMKYRKRRLRGWAAVAALWYGKPLFTREPYKYQLRNGLWFDEAALCNLAEEVVKEGGNVGRL